jgi:hypothetical protein
MAPCVSIWPILHHMAQYGFLLLHITIWLHTAHYASRCLHMALYGSHGSIWLHMTKYGCYGSIWLQMAPDAPYGSIWLYMSHMAPNVPYGSICPIWLQMSHMAPYVPYGSIYGSELTFSLCELKICPCKLKLALLL